MWDYAGWKEFKLNLAVWPQTDLSPSNYAAPRTVELPIGPQYLQYQFNGWWNISKINYKISRLSGHLAVYSCLSLNAMAFRGFIFNNALVHESPYLLHGRLHNSNCVGGTCQNFWREFCEESRLTKCPERQTCLLSSSRKMTMRKLFFCYIAFCVIGPIQTQSLGLYFQHER